MSGISRNIACCAANAEILFKSHLKDGELCLQNHDCWFTIECERLLEDGLDPNQLGPDGVSPLHLGAGLGIKPVCLLLQHRGNPNIRSSDGTTPVQVAAMWGEADCLQILLANGGDPFLEDQDGLNALELARNFNQHETVELLEQYMALLSAPTEETITPKYTYTRRSTGSSERSDSPDLPETTLDILAHDSQILQRDLQEFTKRRRSSVYLRCLQNEMNNYFCDGQKTHLVDVTSPDHPYITPRHSTDNNLDDPDLSDYQGRPPETTQPLSPVEESLHLHLSLSDDELSQSGDTSCDSFVTCDGEGLDQLNKSFNEGSEDETGLLNTVIKTSKSQTGLSCSSQNNSNSNQSEQRDTVKEQVGDRGDSNNTRKKPVSSRRTKYCRREPLFLPPETQDLVLEKCELCSGDVDNFVSNSGELICKSCDRLSKELDTLCLDKSETVKEVTNTIGTFKDNFFSGTHNHRDKSNKTENTNSKPAVPKEKPTYRNKNNSHQDIDEMVYKLRQSSLHRNLKVNVYNIPFSAKTKDLSSDKVPGDKTNMSHSAKTNDWMDNSLISSDESFIGTKKGVVKSEFHPSDLSSITLEDSETDSTIDFLGSTDESSASTVKLKDSSASTLKTSSASTIKFQDNSEYRRRNTIPMSRFHDSDMSTITEVTELDSADLTIFKDSTVVNRAKHSFGNAKNSKIQFSEKTEKALNDKAANKDQHIPDILVADNEVDNIKDSSQDIVDLWDEVRAQTMRNKNMLNTGFFRRESLSSYASDATTVEYIYTDPENGIALLERHIPSVCGSVASRRSIDSQFSLTSHQSGHRHSDVSSCGESDNTEIYDWREEAMCEGFGVKDDADRLKTPTNKPELNKLNNKAIRTKLCAHGADPGPVTNSTRQTYLTRLSQLENDPDAKIITKKSPEYPSELRLALSGNLDMSKMAEEEEKMFAAFQKPSRDHRWREGTLKSSFNYILLDPRVTKDLPNRSCNMRDLDVFQTFISAIFYIGKGKRARPYCHLHEAIKHLQKPTDKLLACFCDCTGPFVSDLVGNPDFHLSHFLCGKGKRARPYFHLHEAIKHLQKPSDKVSSKVSKIVEIWSAGLGVVSLHCFQSVIPVEAYTREACMVDALGLHKLTNMKRGDYYGISVTYSMKKRREIGVYLLTKALRIFLAEGERQILPLDIKADYGAC